MSHPILQEISSLRRSAAQFQHESQAAAVKLQRYSLDAARLRDHSTALERENARLSHEIDVLRSNPDEPPHPALQHVQELSLSLRRLSDKVALTEDTLLARTTDLTDARSQLVRATYQVDAAYELAARMRAREEAANARIRKLEFKARASEDERKMVDLVLQEYADLVRNLEGRKSATHSLQDTLQQGRSSLHANLTALSAQSEQLHATIAELNTKVSDLQMTLDAERASAAHDRTLLSQAKTQLDKLDLEGQTAAKMVTRYMKFSQASTNALQQQIMTLRTRHASTVATLQIQLSVTESKLASERTLTARLRDALDELCQDLARESYGRRREVSLRLALLSREEAVAEFMRRWARRATESYARCYDSPRSQPQDPVQEAFHRVVTDAVSLLSSLDDDVQISDAISTSGSLARVALSSEAVDALRTELQDELRKRLEAVQRITLQNGHLDGLEDHARPETMPNGDPNTHSPVSTKELSIENVHPEAQDSAPVISEPEPPQEITEEVDTLPETETNEDQITEDNAPIPISTPTHAPATPPSVSEDVVLVPPLTASPTMTDPSSPLSILLSEIEGTQHRYDTLQRAFRDCSVALKYLRDTLASSSPSSAQSTATTQTILHRHLEAALARIDDYTEDARVELEIQIADEALAARGFVTVLSVLSPGGAAPVSSSNSGTNTYMDEREEVEANARAFVDGTEDGVRKAMERFKTKLEHVEHDVAVVKRALHRFTMDGDVEADLDVDDGDADPDAASDDEETENKYEDGNGDANTSWTAWTAGLLGSTPVVRERSDRPLAGLNLRVPMPVGLDSALSERGYGQQLGLGRPMNGSGRANVGLSARTMSAMYAVGGLRSASSLGLGMGVGVGLGGSSSAVLQGVPVRRDDDEVE